MFPLSVTSFQYLQTRRGSARLVVRSGLHLNRRGKPDSRSTSKALDSGRSWRKSKHGGTVGPGGRPLATPKLQKGRRLGPGPPSVAPVVVDTPQSEERSTASRPPNLPSIWALIVLSLAYLHHSTTGCAPLKLLDCGMCSCLFWPTHAWVGIDAGLHCQLCSP